MELSPYRMPDASTFESVNVDKKGRLHKFHKGPAILLGYFSSWREKYCIVVDGRLYIYDSKESHGRDKSSACINLAHFTTCEEASRDDTRRAPYAFVLYHSDSDINKTRHLFYAVTEDQMDQWMEAINNGIIRGTCRMIKPVQTQQQVPVPCKRVSSKKKKAPQAPSHQQVIPADLQHEQPLRSSTKNRAKGPEGRRLPQRFSQIGSKIAEYGIRNDEVPLESLNESSEEMDENLENTGNNDILIDDEELIHSLKSNCFPSTSNQQKDVVVVAKPALVTKVDVVTVSDEEPDGTENPPSRAPSREKKITFNVIPLEIPASPYYTSESEGTDEGDDLSQNTIATQSSGDNLAEDEESGQDEDDNSSSASKSVFRNVKGSTIVLREKTQKVKSVAGDFKRRLSSDASDNESPPENRRDTARRKNAKSSGKGKQKRSADAETMAETHREDEADDDDTMAATGSKSYSELKDRLEKITSGIDNVKSEMLQFRKTIPSLKKEEPKDLQRIENVSECQKAVADMYTKTEEVLEEAEIIRNECKVLLDAKQEQLHKTQRRSRHS